MITRARALGTVSLLVGLSLGAVGGALLRAQAGQGPAFDIRARCEKVDQFVGPFLAPTGVRLTLDVAFRSSMRVETVSGSPFGDSPLFAAVFALPDRWTAYMGAFGAPVLPGELLGPEGDAPDEVALPGRDSGLPLDVIEGRRTVPIDLRGPTDAEPGTFSLRAVVRDVDGALLERTIDDVCPLPAGSQHRPEGEG